MAKEKCECHSMHRWFGLKMLFLGLLVLANVYYAVLGWATFIGLILALAGLCKLVMPGCCCK